MSSVFSKMFSVHAIVVIAGFVTLMFLQLDHFADDPGVGWHMQTGKQILHDGLIPLHDPFLAPPTENSSRSWISDQWLGDLLLYIGYQDSSWALLYALGISLYLFTFLVVLYRGIRDLCGSALAASFACFVSFKLGLIHFILRPVMFSFLFFLLLWITLLKNYRRPDLAKIPKGHFIGLGLLFIAWANVHPSFVLGLGVIGILLFSLITDDFLLGNRKHPSSFTQQTLLLLLCCSLATLVNPYGYQLHQSIVSLSRSDYFLNLNNEWQRLNLNSPEGKLLEIVLGIIIFAQIARRNFRSTVSSFEILSSIVFLYGSLNSVRLLPYFAIIIAIILAESLISLKDSYVCDRYPVFRQLRSLLQKFELEESSRPRGMIVFGAISCLLIILALCCQRLPFYTNDLGPSTGRYPYQAVSRILSNHQAKIVVSIPDWGGFLTLQGQGEIKPIIDDRNTLLGEKFYKDYFAALEPGADWYRYINRFKANYILLPHTHDLIPELNRSNLVRLVYQEDAALYAVHPSPSSSAN